MRQLLLYIAVLLVALPSAVLGVEITGIVETRPVSPIEVNVYWETDIASDSLVEYGLDEVYSNTVYDPTPTTEHNVAITITEVDVVYDIRVTSQDGGITEPAVAYGWHDSSVNVVDFQLPEVDEIVYGEVQLKAMTNDSWIETTSASFEVIPDDTGLPVIIGEDLDGTDFCYNSFLSEEPVGDGWSAYWDSPLYPDGGYTLAVTMNTDIGVYYATRHVVLDNTPPIPDLVIPEFGERCYNVVNLEAGGAADADQVEFKEEPAEPIITFPGILLNQNNYGYPNRPDFGKWMCHATSQAMILWTNSHVRNTYTNDVRNKTGTAAEGKRWLVWDLAYRKGTVAGRGVDNDNSSGGSRAVSNYVKAKSNKQFDWKYDTFGTVTIKKLKNLATQPEGKVRGVGLSLRDIAQPQNSNGHMVVLKKIDDNPKVDENGRKYYELTIANPMNGQEETYRVNSGGGFEYPAGSGDYVCINGGFRYTGTPTDAEPSQGWQTIGIDTDPTDGWSVSWNTTGKAPGLYYIKAIATQSDGLSGFDMTELVIPARTTASGAKEYPDGMPVDVLDCAVTYIQPSEFWIESTDRVCGIGVIGGDPSLLRDDILSEVRGSMTTVGLERRIAAYEIISAGTQEAIGPLAVPNRSVVGGDFCYDLAVGSGQMGGPGAYGINSIGMLIRTWGRCLGTTYSADGTQYYVIDDGSAVTGWPASGVMLLTATAINTDHYVTATGICCLEDWDAGGIVPIIRARDSDDVQASPMPW